MYCVGCVVLSLYQHHSRGYRRLIEVVEGMGGVLIEVVPCGFLYDFQRMHGDDLSCCFVCVINPLPPFVSPALLVPF